MNDYDAVEDLRLIVWAVIAQDESIDDPDGLATCDARTGYTARPQGWGETPVYCTQSVGLRTLRDAAGRTRRYCSRDGHRRSVVRRYGEWIEPESAPISHVLLDLIGLGDGCIVGPHDLGSPESADPITAAKGWTEAELREAWGR